MYTHHLCLHVTCVYVQNLKSSGHKTVETTFATSQIFILIFLTYCLLYKILNNSTELNFFGPPENKPLFDTCIQIMPSTTDPKIQQVPRKRKQEGG